MKNNKYFMINNQQYCIRLVMTSLLMWIGYTVWSQPGNVKDLYSHKIVSNNKTSYSLQEFKGEKIVVVVLPAKQTDQNNMLLNRIDTIARNFKGKIQIIAAPSYDLGLEKDSVNTIMQWYQKILDPGIIISQPLYTHKNTKKGNQDAVFSWLTHSSQNIHFDNEVNGAGSLFIIDENGSLKGVLGMWNMQSLNMILHSN